MDGMQVARRVRGADHVAKSTDPGSGGKKRAVRYQCGLQPEEVFLHPHSALYKTAPDFVVYSHLIRSTKRPYMAGNPFQCSPVSCHLRLRLQIAPIFLLISILYLGGSSELLN
jgi:hypothetical protein